MDNKSLPARPSLEQLKKLAKDLVRNHREKQPAALALIREHLPALSGKTDAEIAAYPFALHDAQSVMARQHGFPSWNELQAQVQKLEPGKNDGPIPPADIAAVLKTIITSYQTDDYELFRSTMSEQMEAAIPKERFQDVNRRMSVYFKSDYQLPYMGSVRARGRTVHFWRLSLKEGEDEMLMRMVLNGAGQVSGLLFSDPFDTAAHARK